MTEIIRLITDLHLTGLVIGLVTFIVIGLFHPMVIKGEFYLGARLCAPLFLLLGIAAGIASVMVGNSFASPILGVIAFSSFWSIKEVREQQSRVEKGWFPQNPKRRHDPDNEQASTKN